MISANSETEQATIISLTETELEGILGGGRGYGGGEHSEYRGGGEERFSFRSEERFSFRSEERFSFRNNERFGFRGEDNSCW